MGPHEVRHLVAENIRAAAEAKGVGINALADFAAVSRAQLFNVLGGSASPTVDWLAKIAEALEVAPWQLLAPGSGKNVSSRGEAGR